MAGGNILIRYMQAWKTSDMHLKLRLVS
jgi:hypothetical protein